MPYKLSIWIVVALLSLNGGAVMLDASGASDYLDLSTQLGDTEDLEASDTDARNVQTGSGTGSTLFGLYQNLGDVLGSVVNSIYPGAKMLKNAGMPNYLVDYIMAGLSVIPAIDIIKFLRSG